MTDSDNKKTPKQMAEAVLIPLDQKANPNSKDGVFCNLFSDPRYLLLLYLALHPEDQDAKISDITLVTLEKDRKSTRLNSSHPTTSRMPSAA